MGAINKSRSSLIWNLVIAALLGLLVVATIFPFWYVICVSFSSQTGYLRNPLMLIPQQFTVSAYRKIVTYPMLWTSYKNTILVTVCGTALNLALTCLMAYPLSKSNLRGAKAIMLAVVFSMVFKPSLLPKFLVVRELGLYDTYLALILPTAVAAYNLILMKNFFIALPASLEESAYLDGANEFRILFSIVIPLSLPAIASIGLFYAVGHWNNYMSAVVYIKSMSKWPLQLLLREVVASNSLDAIVGGTGMSDLEDVLTFTIQMAAVVVSVVPILVVYPFVQRYFVKGVNIGAVKE